MSAQLSVPVEEQRVAETGKWELKEIKPWHKHLCSLLVQGLDQVVVAKIMDCTPQYVSMLARQPKLREYMRELSSIAELRLEGQFTKVVTAIGDVLENGNAKEQIAAGRLHAELTKRIGSRAVEESKLVDTNSRLAKLAEKLLYLQGQNGARSPDDIIDGEVVNEKAIEQDAHGEGSKGRPDQSA